MSNETLDQRQNNKDFVSVVILTKDEEMHIARCIESVAAIASEIVVVDSGSTDRTVDIATSLGAQVHTNPWRNYATQFNWGLQKVSAQADWVMRLDADEIVNTTLSSQIASQLHTAPDLTVGFNVSRRISFLGRPIQWGGVFPVHVLRLFRNGAGHCENRWMDEHIIVDGDVGHLKGEILDDNKNSLTWWTTKHNSYASREVVDLLNLEYGFMPHETIAEIKSGQQAGLKRWLKENVYANLPGGSRAMVYFLYRYVIRLGFLDGKEGAVFHVLQGFWYRYLVDAKLSEVKKHMKQTGADPVDAIKTVLKIEV